MAYRDGDDKPTMVPLIALIRFMKEYMSYEHAIGFKRDVLHLPVLLNYLDTNKNDDDSGVVLTPDMEPLDVSFAKNPDFATFIADKAAELAALAAAGDVSGDVLGASKEDRI